MSYPKLLLKLQILKIAYVAIVLMVSKMFRGLTSEWNAIHKHDTIVIKLQINKCCTRLFELYWTDTFQREVKHCSGNYELRKNKIMQILTDEFEIFVQITAFPNSNAI